MSDSSTTKQALANALKDLCRFRNFDKISINELTSKCKLNRQTFYYHFQDKYDLLHWLYYNELFAPTEDLITFNNWEQCLLTILEKIYQDKDFYSNTINNNERYFYQDIYNLAKRCFHEPSNKLNIKDNISIQEKNFCSEFYTYAFSGVILQWIKNNMKIEPVKLAQALKKTATQSDYAASNILKL